MGKRETLFIAVVVAVTLIFAGISLLRATEVISLALERGAAPGSAGQPRDLDDAHIKALIQEKQLSNREADFWKPVVE